MGNVIYSFTGFQNSGMCRRTFIYGLPKSGNVPENFRLWFPKIREGASELSFMVSQNQGRCRRTFIYGLPKSRKGSEHLLLWVPKNKERIGAFAFLCSQNQGNGKKCFFRVFLFFGENRQIVFRFFDKKNQRDENLF